MRKIFLLLALTTAALAQSPCSLYCGINGCGQYQTTFCDYTNPLCDSPQGWREDVWKCWPDFSCTGSYQLCYIDYGCDPFCSDGGFKPVRGSTHQREPVRSWTFDPIRIVMSLLPRLHAEWKPVGPGGSCKLIRM